ncbi:ABC transporter permease [Capillimicrobium parvum]|uniref:Autoinducer 2 import system permease protein LsrC n=1 Tax=Capillimicrobium parvum TaxID=2884022 RepID=A0A9E7C256_9ACTN|nr:ABC transporter permease [Capillimicrobium parvum]UGS37287.1 Ribose import permease protein RbsC [Capillimicrobium parvum]
MSPTADAAKVAAPSAPQDGRWRRSVRLQELGPLLGLVAIVLVIGVTHSRFFSDTVIMSNVRTASVVAIIAFGIVFLLAMTEIDLSVGGIYGVCFYLAAKLMGDSSVDPYLAAVIALAAGVAMGAFNGVAANAFRVPVIIVTLGTFSLYRGLVSVISGGEATPTLPVDSSFFTTFGGDWLGIPVIGWFAVVIGAVLTFVMQKTRFGVMVRAVGSNREAARFSGIPSGRVRLYALMLTGLLAALSGVLSLAYFEAGDPSIGRGLELNVIAAAIIGGTSLSGGTGSVPGALIGALIVAAITSGLVFFKVDPLWGDVVTGIVILVAVGIAGLLRRQAART